MNDFILPAAKADAVREFVKLAFDDVAHGGDIMDEVRDINGDAVELKAKVEAVFWELINTHGTINIKKPEMFAACKLLFEYYFNQLVSGEE